MTTKTVKKQASTTVQRAKRTTTSAKNTSQRTATQARRAGEAAQRTVRTVVADSAYATVGLTDTAIAFARTLPTKLSTDAPKAVEETPRVVEQRLETLRRNAEREFDVLAQRGRSIVSALSSKNTAAQRAADQARTARQQLKAATTSLRKAVFSGTEAVETTVETAGRQAEREQYQAMTVAELQDIARRKGVENRSEKNKQQLINALLSA